MINRIIIHDKLFCTSFHVYRVGVRSSSVATDCENRDFLKQIW